MTGKMPVDLLLTHGQVLTMDSERRIFADGAVAVNGRDIVAVGRTEDVLAAHDASETWDVGGALVRPGFVDAHLHVTFQLLRSILPDYWSEDRAWQELWVHFWDSVTPEEEYLAALLSFMEIVRNGSTSFVGGATDFDLPSIFKAANQVGVRGLVGEFLWDLEEQPPRLRRSSQACIDRIQAQLEEYPLFGPDERVGVCVMVLGMNTASDALLQGAKELADRYGVMMNVHQSYGRTEVQSYIDNVTGGKRPLVHQAELGILGPNVMLVHINNLTPEEVEVLVDTGTCGIHCPSSSMKYALGSSHVGYHPDLVVRGVPLALGSDSSNWSNYFDMGMQIYLAATLHREATMVLPTITAEQALEMGTLNGARVMGIPDLVGVIEAGRRADIVVDRMQRPEWHPGLDLVYDLVYAAQSKSVDTVLIDGQVVLKDGHFVTFDEEAAYAEIDRAARALVKRLGFSPPERWPVIR
jgi:5-methylthioadenosine/S-adenosylhomocysteine deaminase